jgi:hypothetical protein
MAMVSKSCDPCIQMLLSVEQSFDLEIIVSYATATLPADVFSLAGFASLVL